MESFKQYYDYLLQRSSEYPEASKIVKSAAERMGVEVEEPVEIKTETTNDDSVVNFVLNKMAGDSLDNIETVLRAVGNKVDELKSQGVELTTKQIVEKLKDNTLL